MKPFYSSITSWAKTRNSQCLAYSPTILQELQNIIQQPYASGIIAYGQGLNYGDQAFNSNGNVVFTQHLNKILEFNSVTGELTCEPGVRLCDILNMYLPLGWGPPVLPGSLFVTLGGAVANDVHGKDNQQAGSFGHHVKWMELITPSETLCISPEHNSALFYATIGGLGLTGIISKICLQLKSTASYVNTNHQPYQQWQELLENLINVSSAADYAIAWLDLSNFRVNKGRGILTTADFALDTPIDSKNYNSFAIPKLPFSIINEPSIRLFNQYYYRRIPPRGLQQQQHLLNFMNPLDKIKAWNNLYGPAGLIQFQCLFNFTTATTGISELFKIFERYSATAGLAVIKVFWQSSLGLLSFPSPGITLAVDFPNRAHNIAAVKAAHSVVAQYGGKLYLAKDSLLEASHFQKMYANYQLFNQIREQYGVLDSFQSDMSRRLKLNAE